MDVFIGMIAPFGFNFAPADWAMCLGQQLEVGQYQALYSLIQNMYGGTAPVNFNLPNLEGRSMVGGQAIHIGALGGSNTATLTLANLPNHTHAATLTGLTATLAASSSPGTSTTPANNPYLSASPSSTGMAAEIWSSTLSNPPVAVGGLEVNANGAMQIGSTGGSQPFSIANPYLTVNFCIALMGLYPMRP